MEIFGDVSFQDAHTVEARLLQEVGKIQEELGYGQNKEPGGLIW